MASGEKSKRPLLSVSVTGEDRPGIVAAVSKVLFENGCNIEALSQTVIMGEFAMIVIATPLPACRLDALMCAMEGLGQKMGLDIRVRPIERTGGWGSDRLETEPFVITVRGPDRPGLVAAITEVLAAHNINITRLGAEVVDIGKGVEYIQIYEVDVPKELDFSHIQQALRLRGEQVGVVVDMQHRDIFRAINQI